MTTVPAVTTEATPLRPLCSVVVPAHDEAMVLGATLDALVRDLDHGEVEVVVVANGCSDTTAAVAAAVPGVTVVVLDVASKTAALNAGDEVATTLPRVYLDADVRLGAAGLRVLARALSTGEPVVAAPAPVFDTSSSSWAVRMFYAVFTELPYVREALVGLGVYGLSASGRARFDAFPDVTADDLFVQRLFAPHERLRPGAGLPAGTTFVVAAPRTLSALVAVRRRVARGNAELAVAGAIGRKTPVPPVHSGPTTRATVAALVATVAHRPHLIPAAAVYAGVTVWARWRAGRAQGAAWERDASTRAAVVPTAGHGS